MQYDKLRTIADGLNTPSKSRTVSLCPAFEHMRKMRGKISCQECARSMIRRRMQRSWSLERLSALLDISFVQVTGEVPVLVYDSGVPHRDSLHSPDLL